MNINDFLPQWTGMEHTYPNLERMFQWRRETYQGFAELESTRGFLKPQVSLATSYGQEMLRSLLMRFFEELTEALEATDPDHILEELIDAVNYLWSMLILDPDNPPSPKFIAAIYSDPWVYHEPLTEFELGRMLQVAGTFLAKLRNRSWQNHSQSLYFDGGQALEDFVTYATLEIMGQFTCWDQFASFFWAKDQVLKFRLQSKY